MSKPGATNAVLQRVAHAPIEPASHAAHSSTELECLRCAVDHGFDEGWGFQVADIERIESTWSLEDGDALSFGYVLKLRNGRRAYVDYADHVEDGEVVVQVTMQPMGDERYPELDGAIPGWDDDVGDLNRPFAH